MTTEHIVFASLSIYNKASASREQRFCKITALGKIKANVVDYVC